MTVFNLSLDGRGPGLRVGVFATLTAMPSHPLPNPSA